MKASYIINELFMGLPVCAENLYRAYGGCTRLAPLPGTPAEIQREIEARAVAKRAHKNLKRFETWRGKV